MFEMALFFFLSKWLLGRKFYLFDAFRKNKVNNGEFQLGKKIWATYINFIFCNSQNSMARCIVQI